MKRSDWIRFGVTVAVLFAAVGLLYPFWPLQEVIKLGLDLQGGVRLVLEAKDLEQMSESQRKDVVDRIVTIFQQRVDQYGLANVEIRPLGQSRIEVKIPGAQDPAEARQLIGRTALLEFRKVIDSAGNPDDLVRTSPTQEILASHDEATYYLVEGEPMVTGDVLDDAEVRTSTDPRNPGLYIALKFNRAGAERFAEALRRLQVGERLAIVLDGVVYSAPAVSESAKQAAQQGWREVQSSLTITGRFTFDQAKLLAVVLRSGALPTEVGVLEEQTVGPTLGSDSIRRGSMAILISFILVLLYMVVYYRWMGLVADAALILNMLIVFAALRGFGATLTMPGIAGLILTIGMTVDADVIIFERIKEERRAGKPARAAINGGFAKSMSALLDANLTTIITALILFSLGSGPVEGFAITLALGVAGSLFCALVASRLLLETTGIGERIPVRVKAQG
ncbi:MAG: Protein-export membrane protein SecD [Acetothermia bacterium 64_32]|nr:MAG: Protein-export membrane protein SecD [Acetothermia bacterium 64_32]HAF69930.1 protein translocase subunit SecD [Candidatus Acetothermia bacterium]